MKRYLLSLITLLLFLPVFPQANHWETAIYGTDTFSYFIGRENPPAAWRMLNYDDNAWLKGKGGLGYGESNLNTIVPDSTLSIYIRKKFKVEDSSKIIAAVISADYDDGFVSWINGTEVARENLGIPGDIPSFNTAASSNHEGLTHQGLIPSSFIIDKSKLRDLIKNGENVICMQVNNILATSSDLTALIYLSFGISDSSHYFDTIPYWFVPPVPGSGSLLPLIIINTHGQQIPDGVKITADMGIIDNGTGKFNYPDDVWNAYKGKAGIEIRGSSSTMFPKNNYNLETRDSTGVELNISLLGLPEENDWVLYGPYPDKSLIRNYLLYNLVNSCGQWAPHTRLCELYHDGEYRGIYFLVEKIKRDKHRVNVAKMLPTDNQGIQLTGGYIVKIDRSSTGDYTDGWNSPYFSSAGNTKTFFVYDYPKWGEITYNQQTYIKNRITAFETLLTKQNFDDPIEGYKSLINVNSFIEHFIFTEMCRNVDGYRLSTFLYKDRDDRDPRINAGPVWDYDLAFGNANYYDGWKTDGWEYLHPNTSENDAFSTPFWWSRFLQDKDFVNSLNCRWKQLRQGPLNSDSVDNVINNIVSDMGPEVAKNFNKFDQLLGIWVWPNYFVGNTHAQEIDYLKTWISGRFSWLDANMPGVCVVDEISNKITGLLNLHAYPNPAFGNINIEVENPLGANALIQIFDLYGQLITSRNLKAENYYLENFNLPAGSYIVRLSTTSGLRAQKIIIY